MTCDSKLICTYTYLVFSSCTLYRQIYWRLLLPMRNFHFDSTHSNYREQLFRQLQSAPVEKSGGRKEKETSSSYVCEVAMLGRQLSQISSYATPVTTLWWQLCLDCNYSSANPFARVAAMLKQQFHHASRYAIHMGIIQAVAAANETLSSALRSKENLRTNVCTDTLTSQLLELATNNVCPENCALFATL